MGYSLHPPILLCANILIGDSMFPSVKVQRAFRKNNEVKSLPPRVAAWIILLHDLVLNWKPERIARNLVRGLLEEIKALALTHLRKKRTNQARKIHKRLYQTRKILAGLGTRSNGNWVHFPFPKIDTFRQLDRFLWIWNSGIEDSKSLELEDLVPRWEEAAWIATSSEDRYDAFVLTPDQAETDKRGRTTFKRTLFSEHSVLRKALTTRRRG